MKTIAQQLKIKEFPFIIKDSDGNKIYREHSNGVWSKWEYDADGNETYYEYSKGYWEKRRFPNSCYWEKREYAEGKVIYFENSNGLIKGNRPKTDVQKAIDLLTKEGLIVDGQILKA